MEAKHTKGPWVARKWKRPKFADGFVTVVTDNRGHGLVEFLQKGKNAKVEANARLIASAPTMLKKLVDTVAWLDLEIEDRLSASAALNMPGDVSHLEKLRDDLAETLRKIGES